MDAVPARLDGWRRRFSQARDNSAAEKTFATPGGEVPPFVLGLNVEPAEAGEEGPNGVLLPVSEDELARLDLREVRYDRVDVTAAVAASGRGAFETVVVYVAKQANHAPDPPAGAVILTAYASAVEAAFAALGSEALELYRRTTLPYPAPLVEGLLVRDEIPPGNPRDW